MIKNIDEKSINEARYLAVSAITKASSGHPGIALGSAPILYSLFSKEAKICNNYPDFFNRDRIVLCAGHVSTLYYSLLHIFGYNYKIQDLKNLRKMNSICKGHPNANPKLGIDATGGPLGQGIPMAVGMAIAETILAAKFNRPNFELFNHYTYAFASDGSIMEGISNEASSLAGTLALDKLIVLYDSNNITIEGQTDLAFNEDVLKKYEAFGWNTIEVKNGNNVVDIEAAIEKAKAQKGKPTIIKIDTTIGLCSPVAGKNKAHGTPLSETQLAETKKGLCVDIDDFSISDEVYENAQNSMNRTSIVIEKELQNLEKYKKQYSKEYEELNKWLSDSFCENIDWEEIKLDMVNEATRKSSHKMINKLADLVPNFFVGSADLAPSVLTDIVNGGDYSKANRLGRNLHFGIREHAMAAICNGIALHGGIKILCSTFMVFSDYMRHAVRMSALMSLPVIYALSHDSIGVGEDGKTHQPVEYNAIYRATPNINFIRPADAEETKYSYKEAMKANKPTVLALSRQTLVCSGLTSKKAERGAYIVFDSKNPEIIFVGTGSELSICIDAAKELSSKGINVRVVSMPSVNIFESQPKAYQEKILPNEIRKRIVVEAGSTICWYKYAGIDGKVIGVDSFGFTASGDELFEKFGFTTKNLIKEALKLLKK